MSVSSSTVIDLSATPGVPEAIFRTQAYADGGIGNALTYSVDVPNGTYRLRLYFAETYYQSRGGADIVVEGAVRTENYRPFVAAGGMNRSTMMTYDVTVTDGNLTFRWLAAAAITSCWPFRNLEADRRCSPDGPCRVSPDNGATWVLVSADAAMDRYGYGTPCGRPASTPTRTQFWRA